MSQRFTGPGRIAVQGTLPAGAGAYSLIVSRDIIVVQVADRACIAHPKWMTRDQLTFLWHSLGDLLDAPVTDASILCDACGFDGITGTEAYCPACGVHFVVPTAQTSGGAS